MQHFKIPYYLIFLGRIVLISLLTFCLLRILLLWYAADQSFYFSDPETWICLQVGIRFDMWTLSYLLALPLLLLFVQSFFLFKNKVIPQLVTWYITLVFPAILFLTIADIPYFKFFHNRITESAFQWMSTPGMVFNMIIQSKENLFFLSISVVLLFYTTRAFYRAGKKGLIEHNWLSAAYSRTKTTHLFYLLPALIITFLGMRGRMDHPLRQGDAFYGINPIVNQAGLNPFFTLVKSLTEKVKLMDEKTAIENTRHFLEIESSQDNGSPFTRRYEAPDTPLTCNVVLVLMESMSGNYMKRFGNEENLTPTLDSLANLSLFFDHAYSAGIHTNNGIFSSLYSFPALLRIRPMSMVPARKYSGIPYVLKKAGYKTMFFTSHGDHFDNMGTFIPANHFDTLYSDRSYPLEESLGTFGVPDDYLFSFAIRQFNRATDKPFFATILTSSNHEPYGIPENFYSPFKEKDKRAVNYADWSIGKFLNDARKYKWFKNTLFIFVADHGLLVGQNPYDLPLSYHHIPLMFYGPGLNIKPKVYDGLTGQIDIFPTLMHFLNRSYTNTTLGMDVFGKQRPYIYFSADDKIACLDKEWLYLYRYDGHESLYHYSTSDLKDYAASKPEMLKKMKDYALSQVQSSGYVFSRDLAAPVKE